MFKRIGDVFGRKDGASGAGTLETFGSVKVPRSLGDEILRESTTRRNHVQAIRDRLSSMDREEKDELVDRVFARLALFVYDLPASESNHHSGRFGLLDHLLEAASWTVRELSSPGFRVSPEPQVNHRERPLWVYAGLVAAIAHDIGKPLDLDVTAPGKGVPWDPRIEPLAHFSRRHGLSGTGPELWHFHPRRGLRGHEKEITTLLPLVLTAEVRAYLGPRMDSILGAMTANAEWKLVGGRLQPANEVVRVVRQVDERSAAAGQGAAAATKGRTPSVTPEVPGLAVIAPPARVPELRPEAPKLIASPERVPQTVVVADSSPERPAEDDADQDPLILPSDYWGEDVPTKSTRRGDPVELERRLQAALEPATMIDRLRRMVLEEVLSRNDYYTEVYIRPDYVWFLVARTFRTLAVQYRLPWDKQVLRRMFRALRACPEVVPGSDRRVPVFMKPRLDTATFEAVRVTTRGLFSEAEVATLGVYAYDLKALAPDRGSLSLGALPQ